MRPKPEKSNEDHRLLYEAIAGGEAEKAQQIHRKHRLEAMEILIGLLEKFGFRRV
jgi:DNA-binding FadR family transcriptional regulator